MKGLPILGPRLEMVGSFVPRNAKLGDIGTDHAYLPITLFEKGRICKAIAVDIHQGPYQSACEAVAGRNLNKVIDVRLGDGLQPIRPGEVNALTIAGMGGKTMLHILQEGEHVLSEVTDLVVQPQGAEASVRRELTQIGWFLAEETLVEEESRVYSVMAYSKKSGLSYDELKKKGKVWEERLNQQLTFVNKDYIKLTEKIHSLVWHFGPLILEKPSALLKNLFEEKLNILGNAITQMKKSKTAEVKDKMDDYIIEKVIMEEMQKWLFQFH